MSRAGYAEFEGPPVARYRGEFFRGGARVIRSYIALKLRSRLDQNMPKS